VLEAWMRIGMRKGKSLVWVCAWGESGSSLLGILEVVT